MRRTLVLLAAMAAMVVVYAGAALAAPVDEVEPNGGFLCCAGAQNIDDYFSLDADPNITDLYGTITTPPYSTTVPHATINGTGDNTYDYYSFTVPEFGIVTIDVDGAYPGFDSILRLYDSLDAEQQNNNGFIHANDDSPYYDPGSPQARDSALAYPLSAGTYYVKVGSYFDNEVPTGASYKLHVSIPNHVLQDTTAPTVSSVTPTQTTKVSRTAPNITATFSEEMKTDTLNTDTFKLQKAVVSGKGKTATTTYQDVPGVSVTNNTQGTKATLTLPPNSSLAANTTYKVTVNSGAKDLAGNDLAADKVWSFKTASK